MNDNYPKHIRKHLLYADLTNRIAQESKAKRAQVGCIIVKGDNIISTGYNGTPAGFDNNCEYIESGNLITRPEVIHAELNAIFKLAKSNESGEGATAYVQGTPCIRCSCALLQSGISTLVITQDYVGSDGGGIYIIEDKIEIIYLSQLLKGLG